MIIINPYPFFRAEPVVLNKRVSLPDLRDFITTEDAARVLNFHVSMYTACCVRAISKG